MTRMMMMMTEPVDNVIEHQLGELPGVGDQLLQLLKKDQIRAVLHYMSQYSFCWDSVGMDIKDLESVGMDPNRSAPLRASTSPPPPLAYFQHIKLSVPKRKA